MTLRNLARAGSAALLAAGALALSAGPALAAAKVDYGVTASGATVAADAHGKFGTLKLSNLGTTEAKTIGIRFDATGLDAAKVTLDLGGCTVDDGIADCVLDEEAFPKPGTTSDLSLPMVKKDGATGAAGKLRVTVVVEGDGNKANDTAEVTVRIGGNGVDLSVIVPDVTTSLEDDGDTSDEPVKPGELANMQASVINQGDRTADGVTITVTLPKGATFSIDFEGCDLSNGKRTLTCSIDGPYVPYEDQDVSNDQPAGFTIHATLKVSKSLTGPITLKGGVASAAANGVVAETARAKRPSALPAGFTALTRADIAKLDIDGSDNTDGFVVKVGAKAAAPAGGAGGGTGDDDPSLPTTGPVAAVAGGVGALVVVGGGLLLMAARRRRLLLVTPADGK